MSPIGIMLFSPDFFSYLRHYRKQITRFNSTWHPFKDSAFRIHEDKIWRITHPILLGNFPVDIKIHRHKDIIFLKDLFYLGISQGISLESCAILAPDRPEIYHYRFIFLLSYLESLFQAGSCAVEFYAAKIT